MALNESLEKPAAVAIETAFPAAVKVTNQRAVIDRRILSRQIEQAWRATDTPEAFGQQVRNILKAALEAGRAEVKNRFLQTSDGAAAVRGNAFLIDQIIRLTHAAATERIFRAANPTASEQLAIVAVGGYGRGEMAPFSDVDLLFLFPYKQSPWIEQVVEFTLYMLWDLGLKVGHSARSLDECMRQARADTTITTALLESRFITGDDGLFRELRERFQREIVVGHAATFVDAKLAESDQRHTRLGDSRYVVEPNIKDGKGGLRDLHTLLWIAKFAYQADDVATLIERGVLDIAEARRFTKAQNHLWSVRCHLHYLVGRADERLTFDQQIEIAARMGYTDHAALAAAVRDCTHVVHLVGILKETKAASYRDAHELSCAALVQACGQSRVEHITYLSIVGSRAHSPNECLASKGRAEDILLAGSTSACALRVPMVLGEGDYASAALLGRAAQSRSYAFRPESLEQPIYAGDVTAAIRQAAALKYAGGIDLPGPESLSRRALLQRTAKVMGGRTQVTGLPLALGVALAWLMQTLLPNPPITTAMLGVLDHDDDLDPAPAMQALGLTSLRSIEDTISKLLAA